MLSMVAYCYNFRLRAVEVTGTHWPVARSLVSSGFNKKSFLKEIRCSVAKGDKYIDLWLQHTCTHTRAHRNMYIHHTYTHKWFIITSYLETELR